MRKRQIITLAATGINILILTVVCVSLFLYLSLSTCFNS